MGVSVRVTSLTLGNVGHVRATWAHLRPQTSQKGYPRFQVEQNLNFEVPRPPKHDFQISKSCIFKNRSFMKILKFCVTKKSCPSPLSYSKTIESNQRRHFWIVLGIFYPRKLLRKDLMRAVNRQPWLPPGMTRRTLLIKIYCSVCFIHSLSNL